MINVDENLSGLRLPAVQTYPFYPVGVPELWLDVARGVEFRECRSRERAKPVKLN